MTVFFHLEWTHTDGETYWESFTDPYELGERISRLARNGCMSHAHVLVSPADTTAQASIDNSGIKT